MAIRRAKIPAALEPFAYHPEIIALPSIVSGALLRLVVHWYLTDCRELPKADHELAAIARAHRTTWRKYNADILRLFGELRTELLAIEARRVANYAHLDRIRDRGIATKKLKTLQKAMANPVDPFAKVIAPRLSIEKRAAQVSEPSPAPRNGFVDRQR